MKKEHYKATGCLWFFMESICVMLFFVLLVMRLISKTLMWWVVFAPLVVGLAITVVTFMYIALAVYFEDKDGEVDSK